MLNEVDLKKPGFWVRFALMLGRVAVSIFVKNPHSQQVIGNLADNADLLAGQLKEKEK